MKKEAYETAELRIVDFGKEEIITASGGFVPDENEGDPVIG